jgi:ABC-type multidrug transport system fused ATPase/permease subunit
MGLVAAIVIPIVVIGFMGVCIPPEFRWRIAYQDAKTLHFKVLLHGMAYVVTAFILLTGLYHQFGFPMAIELQQFLPHYVAELNSRAGILWLILLFLVSVALVILHFCIHRLYHAKRLGVAFKKGEFNRELTLKTWQEFCKDKPLDNLLLRSLSGFEKVERAIKAKKALPEDADDERDEHDRIIQARWDNCPRVLLTMEDKKVYMGIVTQLSPYNQFNLRPLLSGYRDEKDHTMTFTTDYDGVKSYITLKTSNIVSATRFNQKIYTHFKQQRPKKAPLTQSFLEEWMEKLRKSPD